MNNKEKFFRLARRNRIVKLLLEQIQPLHIELKETTLEQIEKWAEQKHLSVSRVDIVQAARELERADIARFVIGRRGSKSRIEWILDTSDLSQSPDGNGGVEDIAQTNESGAGVVPRSLSADAVPAPHVSKEVIEHAFRVRPDFPVTLRLPADLSGSEAERLAAWIRTLPF